MAKKVETQKEGNSVVTARVSQTYEGPLPAPSDFAAYKETLPNAPERILTMAETEQQYRHKINNKVVNFGLIESICGMAASFILALIFLGAAIYLALQGKTSVAIVLIGAITGLAVIFYLKKEPTGRR